MKTNNHNTPRTFLDSQDLKKNTAKPEQAGAQTIEYIGAESDVQEMNQSIRLQVLGIPERCSNAVEIIEKIESGIPDNSLNGDDLLRIRGFGRDFYSDYHTSPGTVVQHLGFDLTLRTFRALAHVWDPIGEANQLEYLESLEDPLVVYRMGKGSLESAAKEIEWTRKELAERAHMKTPSSILARAKVPKSGVLAITPDLEFIVDPEKITWVELIGE
jgi:hypothetical protein